MRGEKERKKRKEFCQDHTNQPILHTKRLEEKTLSRFCKTRKSPFFHQHFYVSTKNRALLLAAPFVVTPIK